MRIVSLLALCFAVSACSDDEVVTVFEPVAFEVGPDAGVVSPTFSTTDSAVVVAEGEEQAPVPLPPSVATPSDSASQ